jgi:Integrase core domain
VAAALNISQGQISRIERQPDMLPPTLAYLTALGVDAQIIVEVGEHDEHQGRDHPEKSPSCGPLLLGFPDRGIAGLQAQLDTFCTYYNTVRPHRALSRRTPQQTYLARPKATPTGTPLHTGAYRIRHDRIDSNGKLTLRHNSALHHIGMDRRYAGTNVLLLIHDLHIPITTTDGLLLRELQLDATKDYQPQTKPCTMSRDIAVAVAEGFEPPDGFGRLSLSRRVH